MVLPGCIAGTVSATAPPAAAATAAAASNTIKEGDLVIVYESYSSIKPIYVDSKAQFQNRYGAFSQKVSIHEHATAAPLILPPAQDEVL